MSRGSSSQSLMSTLSSGEIAVLRAPAALSALDSHLSSLSSSGGTAALKTTPLESGTSGLPVGFFSEPETSLHVTFIPRAPQKSPQDDNAAKTHDLKRCTRDIARDSHGMEDEIRAMVSSYMVPDEDDEDPELMIGRLVC